MRRVRVLSYNVRSLRDDSAALARVIRAASPDVLCLQEAPRFYRWRQQLGELARRSGLFYVSGGAPSCGTAVLSAPRALVERTALVTLPHQRGRQRRALSSAVLRIADARLAVVSCHLSLSGPERRAQAGRLLRHVQELDVAATVVAGDVNEPPTGRTFTRLAGELQDGWTVAPGGTAFTFPTHAPDRRIDAVFATRPVAFSWCGVPSADTLRGASGADLRSASDHLPVLADLSVPVDGR